MKTISFLCPTRGRAALFTRMCEAIAENTDHLSAVEVIAYIDEDDKESHDLQTQGVQVRKVIQPKAAMSLCNQACLDNAKGDIIILMNDDVVIRTKHWDTILRTAVSQFPDNIYLMYPNDLFKGGKLCTFPILSRKLCEVLIEPFPKQYQGNFIDTHLFDIFQRLRKQGYDRIRYLDNVIFEHMHYRSGKGAFDTTYQARRRFGDDLRFVELSSLREKSANRVIDAIENKALMPFLVETITFQATSFWWAFKYYFTIFAMNKKLPIKWRMWLFTHFLARYWAGKLYR